MPSPAPNSPGIVPRPPAGRAAGTDGRPGPGVAPAARPRRTAPPWLLLGLPTLVGLIHVALVSGRYHFGSFDDDASYVLTAKALLAGQGLEGHLASGQSVVGLYPPGYSALIAPLVWAWPHSVVPLRLFSVACFTALFPLTWVWLGRHGVGPRTRSAVLIVMALGPPIATFASMVMAEAPFLVVLMVLLLAVDAWTASGRLLGRYGVAAVVSAAALIWLKQAGLGLVAGLVLWLLLAPPGAGGVRGRRARAVVLAGGVAATLLPVLVARLAVGVPLAGARYSEELGGYYTGGLAGRLVHVLPSSTWHLLSTAIPATLVPYLEPLPIGGHWPDLWKALSWPVTLLIVVGAAHWARRHRDAAVPMVVVYLGECVLWPYVNERRAVLVLPLLVAWYVTGAVIAGRWAVRRLGPGRRLWAARPRMVAAVAAVAVTATVVGPLVAQSPRDYLYGWGQSSSRPAGSRYVALLSRLGRPSDVVETDYQSTIALLTGHATNWSAFLSTATGLCWLPGVQDQLAADRAGYLVLGDVNKPGLIDSPCLAGLMPTVPWAVPLLHTRVDSASVYELVGPGTGHPDLTDVLASATPALLASGGTVATARWLLAQPEAVTQVSIGQAAALAGPTTSVRMEVEEPGGRWVTLASAPSAVGDGAGRPFLVATPAHPLVVTGLRVVVTGPGAGAGAAISDAAMIGPGPTGRGPAATTTSPG